MNKLLLKNFHLIDPSENLNDVSDLLIEDGIIKQISPYIDLSDVKIIDGNKNLLIPGLIDFHVHYRDPGETYKEEIFTGSRASAKGGFIVIIGSGVLQVSETAMLLIQLPLLTVFPNIPDIQTLQGSL